MNEVIIIAAMSKNLVIGKNGDIPWHISEDFKRFKKLTLNHPCIMGKTTYISLPIKPLPKRENIVLSFSKMNDKNVTNFNDYSKAVDYAKQKSNKVFIIGGYSIYKEGLKYADTLELTLIDKEIDGDTFFPEFDKNEFKEVNRIKMHDEKIGKYWFVTYRKQ